MGRGNVRSDVFMSTIHATNAKLYIDVSPLEIRLDNNKEYGYEFSGDSFSGSIALHPYNDTHYAEVYLMLRAGMLRAGVEKYHFRRAYASFAQSIKPLRCSYLVFLTILSDYMGV